MTAVQEQKEEPMTYEQIREIGRKQEETARQMEKTDRQMKETDKRLGALTNRFGEVVEYMIVPNRVIKQKDVPQVISFCLPVSVWIV
ncbi:hypothetical protein FACS189479_06360 [Spirochaetia bacterium]|nr:hypothetical protein FACS189479_06360 [Spirochaetia bacterium]